MKEVIAFSLKEIESQSFHPIIRGRIAGQPVSIIIDTGASQTVIDKSLTNGLPTIVAEGQEPFAAGINAQRIAIERVEIPTLELEGVVFRKVQAFCSDLSPISNLYEELVGMKIHGLLGCDFLARNGAIINFRKGLIEVKRRVKKKNRSDKLSLEI